MGVNIRTRGRKLCIGHQLAGSHVARGIARNGGQVGCNRADHACGLITDQTAVAGHNAGHNRIRLNDGRIASHQPIGGLHRQDVAGRRVEAQIDIGQHPSEGIGAGHRNRPPACVRQRADIGRMGMTTDHQIDCVIKARNDAGDRRAREPALTAVDVRVRAALHAALVNQHHDRLDALGTKLRHQRIDCLDLIAKLEPGDPSLPDNHLSAAQGHTDERHRHTGKVLDAVGRQQRLSRGSGDDIGRQPLKLRAFKRHRRADHCTPAAVRIDPFAVSRARCRFAATGLQTQQLGLALVELMIADRGEFEADTIEGFDRGFVEKES